MKKHILSIIILCTFVAVASCTKSPNISIEESVAPTATPEISVTAEPLPTDDELVEEEDTGVEILFPYPESEAYGLAGMDAILFDAASAGFSTRFNGINKVWIPHFAILDVRERLGTTYYTCWFRQRAFFDAQIYTNREYHYNNEYDFPKLDGTEDTASMWSADICFGINGVVIFMLREDENGEKKCKVFDGLEWGHPYCEFLILLNPAFDDIITDSELDALYDENSEFPISGARWVTPEDPTELLDEYLNYYFYSGNYDEEWVKEHNEELCQRRVEVLS